MDRWRALYDEYRESETERLERARLERQAESQRRAYEAWARASVEKVLGEVACCAERRSEELTRHAGVRIRVSPPHRAPRAARGEITFVEIRHDEGAVYVYAYLELGHAPLLYFLIPGDVGFLDHPKHPRLISLPGARLVRSPDGEVLLRRVSRDGTTADPSDLGVDDIVFRAFELLLRGRCARRARLSGPTSLGPDANPRFAEEGGTETAS